MKLVIEIPVNPKIPHRIPSDMSIKDILCCYWNLSHSPHGKSTNCIHMLHRLLKPMRRSNSRCVTLQCIKWLWPECMTSFQQEQPRSTLCVQGILWFFSDWRQQWRYCSDITIGHSTTVSLCMRWSIWSSTEQFVLHSLSLQRIKNLYLQGPADRPKVAGYNSASTQQGDSHKDIYPFSATLYVSNYSLTA